jgi:hypothetical protein
LIYNAMHNAPADWLAEHRTRPLRMVYAQDLFEAGQNRTGPVDAKRLEKVADQMRAAPHIPTVIDIESWPVATAKDPDLAATAMGQYESLAERLHKLAMYAPFGFYNWPRCPAPAESGGAWSARAADWGVEELARRCDYAVPVLYTYHADPQIWGERFKIAADAVRRWRKPAIPLLMPAYGSRPTALAYQPLPIDLWRMQVRHCLMTFGAAAVWTGAQFPWPAYAGHLDAAMEAKP